MVKKTKNFGSKSQLKNKHQQQTKEGSEEEKIIEAQKRKANGEALPYNNTAGCCCFPSPTTEQFSLVRLFLQGDRLLIVTTLAVTLRKSAVVLSTTKLVVFDL